jgi:deazaflavin-dependent oxidoreductase (nitroreductase family)
VRTLQVLFARIGNLAARPRRLATLVTRLHARLLRASRGRLRRSLLLAGGQPVLVLTTRGRKSGRARSTPVAYVRDGDDFAISAANAGLDAPPAWLLNLEADPLAEIEVGGSRIPVRARHATGAERDRLRARFTQQNAGSATTAGLTSREIPVLVLEPRDRSGPPSPSQ